MINKPLADSIRPNDISEVVGQTHLLGKGCLFRKVLESNHVPNMIFYGPPGTGKTTVANIIAKNSDMALYKLNGTTANIEDIKQTIHFRDDFFNVISVRGGSV